MGNITEKAIQLIGKQWYMLIGTTEFYSTQVGFSYQLFILSFISLGSARQIPANAELFIDYGVKYWNTNDDEDGREKQDIYWRQDRY